MADETMTLQDAIIELWSWGVVYPHIAVAPVIRAIESAIAERKAPEWQPIDAYDHREEYPSEWTAAYLGTKCEAWAQIEVQKVAP